MAVALINGLTSLSVQAQLAVAQAISSGAATFDQFGKVLVGTEPSSPRFGVPAVRGCVVQILHATDGLIHPPEIDGTPHAANVLLETSRIGLGVSPTLEKSGLFSTIIKARPGGNSKIFVRIFNTPDMDEASFYGDSELFTVVSWKNDVFIPSVASTDQPLDGADDDGDGLNNSWEQALGSDPGGVDTDGDSFTDAEEFLAGTDALDSESLFKVGRLSASESGLVIEWDSVPGKQYEVQYITDVGADNGVFQWLGSVLASSGLTQYLVSPASLTGVGTFRICVVE